MLSGERVFGVMGATEWSKLLGEGMAGVWLIAIPLSATQYGGDELMKFRGDVANTVEVWLEVVEG